MSAALFCEILKLRRSWLPWLTLAACTLAAAVGGLFTFISQDPDRARALGLLGAKAQLAAVTPNWPGYLDLIAQIIGVGGLLIFGMTTLWIFGREFSDRTVKDLLALPTTRAAIVCAKFAAGAVWCLILTGYTLLVGLVIGGLLELHGWTGAALLGGSTRVLLTAVMTIALVTSFAVAASIGRGYLPAVGALFGALFTAQIVAALGYGHWYPYSVPALYSGLAGIDQPPPTVVGYFGVVVAVASIAATALWWRNADHAQ